MRDEKREILWRRRQRGDLRWRERKRKRDHQEMRGDDASEGESERNLSVSRTEKDALLLRLLLQLPVLQPSP
jgi:hypothetical protein